MNARGQHYQGNKRYPLRLLPGLLACLSDTITAAWLYNLSQYLITYYYRRRQRVRRILDWSSVAIRHISSP